ncbi:hypothetical protein KO317_00750 [Candidatus Micrarchaeota archaeon]|nr:hypothetical protein [Candidatus Micrarchaeota archaeon]
MRRNHTEIILPKKGDTYYKILKLRDESFLMQEKITQNGSVPTCIGQVLETTVKGTKVPQFPNIEKNEIHLFEIGNIILTINTSNSVKKTAFDLNDLLID